MFPDQWVWCTQDGERQHQKNLFTSDGGHEFRSDKGVLVWRLSSRHRAHILTHTYRVSALTRRASFSIGSSVYVTLVTRRRNWSLSGYSLGGAYCQVAFHIDEGLSPSGIDWPAIIEAVLKANDNKLQCWPYSLNHNVANVKFVRHKNWICHLHDL